MNLSLSHLSCHPALCAWKRDTVSILENKPPWSQTGSRPTFSHQWIWSENAPALKAFLGSFGSFYHLSHWGRKSETEGSSRVHPIGLCKTSDQRTWEPTGCPEDRTLPLPPHLLTERVATALYLPSPVYHGGLLRFLPLQSILFAATRVLHKPITGHVTPLLRSFPEFPTTLWQNLWHSKPPRSVRTLSFQAHPSPSLFPYFRTPHVSQTPGLATTSWKATTALSDCKIPQLLHTVSPPCSFLAPCGSHSYTASLSLKRHSSLNLPSLLNTFCLVLVIAKLFISVIRKQDPRDWGSRIIHDDVSQGACRQTYVPLNRRQGRG